MEIISKVKNILLNPKAEWEEISVKEDTHLKVLTGYLIPLALIPALAGFIGYGIFGLSIMGMHASFMSIGIRYALVSFITIIGGAYLSAWIIAFLADKFDSEKKFDRAFTLIAYSFTPMCVAGLLLLIPSLSFVAALGGLYGLYLLYQGFSLMMKTPEDKKNSYLVVSLVCVVVATAIVSTLLNSLVISSSKLFF